MDVAGFLAGVQARPWYAGQVVHQESLPPRDGVPGEVAHPLHPTLLDRLEALGLWPPYRHQAEAINAVLGGEHVIVATPAASGKSLCYQAPILHTWLGDRTSRALVLYPTKALAQDQLRSFGALAGEASPRFGLYDGDTPTGERAGIRRSAQVLLTNPDMLHMGILPNHRAWGRFFQGLRYVVVDEAHACRGVFGSHVAALLRRLRRLCAHYGARPRFILCSATIGNPGELAASLTGLPFREVTEDGSPAGRKTFVLWNPPRLAESEGRRSTATEAARLFADLVASKIRTLTFVRSRQMAETVYRAARDLLRREAPDLAAQVAPYRGAYLAEDRRRIERDLMEGRLLGVATTTALELGIDIGDLDATILAGYPGSVASTWQQAGRSGRRREESLAVLVARDDPLDQYLMRHPEFLFGRSFEHALTAPENPYVLDPHLLCAAYEAPLSAADADLFGPTFSERVDELAGTGELRRASGRWFLDPSVEYPAQRVNLRATSSPNYSVVEEETGRILETGIGEASAFSQLHPGAVYLHQGEPYRVTDLDLAARTAAVSASSDSYYTQARELTDTRILRVHRERTTAAGARVFLGEVEVTTQVLAYRKRSFSSEASVGEELVDLPPYRFRTVSLWFEAPEAALDEVRAARLDLAGGLHAAEHAAIGVLPLLALCDRNDIGGVSTPLHPDTGGPAVFIHDGYPGGIGIAERGYEAVEQLWQATLQAVAECPCEDGCPGCIQSPKCGSNNYPLDKAVAVLVLRGLLGLAA